MKSKLVNKLQATRVGKSQWTKFNWSSPNAFNALKDESEDDEEEDASAANNEDIVMGQAMQQTTTTTQPTTQALVRNIPSHKIPIEIPQTSLLGSRVTTSIKDPRTSHTPIDPKKTSTTQTSTTTIPKGNSVFCNRETLRTRQSLRLKDW